MSKAIQLRGQARHRFRLEQMPQTELNAEALVHPDGNLSCQQRVETEQEKIVVGSYTIHFQQGPKSPPDFLRSACWALDNRRPRCDCRRPVREERRGPACRSN
jgi:hypothetical protein